MAETMFHPVEVEIPSLLRGFLVPGVLIGSLLQWGTYTLMKLAKAGISSGAVIAKRQPTYPPGCLGSRWRNKGTLPARHIVDWVSVGTTSLQESIYESLTTDNPLPSDISGHLQTLTLLWLSSRLLGTRRCRLLWDKRKGLVNSTF